MPTDTIKWIEINWKVLDTINDNRSIIGSTEVAIADGQPTNKVAAHWAQKLANRKAQQYAFLDSGATSRVASEEVNKTLTTLERYPGKHSCSQMDTPERQPRKFSSNITYK